MAEFDLTEKVLGLETRLDAFEENLSLLREDFKHNFERITSLIVDNKKKEDSPLCTPTKKESDMFGGIQMEDGTVITGTIKKESFTRRRDTLESKDEKTRSRSSIAFNANLNPKDVSGALINSNVKDNSSLKIHQKDFTYIFPSMPEKLLSSEVWIFLEVVNKWQIEKQQKAHLQGILTDEIRRLGTRTFIRRRKFIFQDTVVATDLNSTYSYTNEMIIAYLIAIAIPLTQKDYIQQFETISTQIWKKSSEDGGIWRDGKKIVHANTILHMYDGTSMYLDNVPRIIHHLTEDGERLNTNQNIPPVALAFGNISQYSFAESLFNQVGLFGENIQKSNDYNQFLSHNTGLNHLQFVQWVAEEFSKEYKEYEIFKDALSNIVEKNEVIRAAYKARTNGGLNSILANFNRNSKGDTSSNIDDYDPELDMEFHSYCTDVVMAMQSAVSGPFDKSLFKGAPKGAPRVYNEDNKTNKAGSGPCYLAMCGECSRAKCNYSHDLKDLDRGSAELIVKMIKFRDSNKFKQVASSNLNALKDEDAVEYDIDVEEPSVTDF
jgi:hypothetical protein